VEKKKKEVQSAIKNAIAKGHDLQTIATITGSSLENVKKASKGKLDDIVFLEMLHIGIR